MESPPKFILWLVQLYSHHQCDKIMPPAEILIIQHSTEMFKGTVLKTVTTEVFFPWTMLYRMENVVEVEG
jgi:hypothetical protein